MAKRAKVSGYTKDDGTKVSPHSRGVKAKGPSPFTLSPSRAGRNFSRMMRSAKAKKRLAMVGFGGLAVGEIAGFLGFKTAGGILVGASLLLGVVGGALWMSARR